MPPFLAALIGAAVTLLVIGFCFGVWLAVRRRTQHEQSMAGPAVDPLVEKLVHELPVGVAVVGPHDELLCHNEAATRLSVVRGSRIGFNELLDLVRGVRRSGEAYDGEVVREPVPGVPRLRLRVRISMLDEQQIAVVGVDEEQSRRVEAVRRDFVANVSHELKTPIGAIAVLAEAVEAAKDDPDAVERFAVRLQRETARLSELVSQIINLSRLQSTDPGIEHEIVSLRAVAGEAMAHCAESAEGRGVTIRIGGSQDALVGGDRWQITDAITNLIQNGINYSHEGARVTLSIIEAEEGGERFVDLKVSDNGIGISKEDQERIFERFYRVDYGRSRSMGGTGLGLSIVRHIMLTHGGTVSVWSNPGQGSTFTLRFPALPPEACEQENT